MDTAALVRRALEEDLGSGDVTSGSLLEGDEKGAGRVFAKSELVVAGIDVFREVFHARDPGIRFEALTADGERLQTGNDIARISGSLRSILEAERTALNFLQRMCGIATMTARFVQAAEGSGARILDTRKTTPGLRVLEKHAVRVGGGLNHRFGLDRGVLIKENHITAAGGITEAVRRVRKTAPPAFTVEVEVRNMDEVREAVECGADIIMLDNMNRDEQVEAVRLIAKRALVEASGNVTLETVRDIAETGVDFISVGAVTHSAPAADISLVLELPRMP